MRNRRSTIVGLARKVSGSALMLLLAAAVPALAQQTARDPAEPPQGKPQLNEIAKDSGGKLQVVVDKFESNSERTSGKPIPLENVYAILPGTDPKLAKTIFIVSGHFDSRPSNVMGPEAD